MEIKRKSYLLEEGGKYCLDVSKLVFGGIILAGIMKQDIEDYLTLFFSGGCVFALLLAFGFILINRSKKNNKR